MVGQRTVVVHEVGNADTEEGGLEAGVQPGDTLALDDAAGGIKGGKLRAFRLDLGACGERDKRIAGRL